MIFTSFEYVIFLPFVVALFWILPKPIRLPLLLFASYCFYMSWNAVFVFLIFGMTVFNWFWGQILHRSTDRRKLVFSLGIITNLLCLGIFKYASFTVQSATTVIGWFGNSPDWSVNIILPLAISFFIFEFIHYLFEIYRGNKPIDSFILFALFAAFFPTQIAGPIKRYPDFAAQMMEEKKLRLTYFDEGIPLIILGMAKKVLLADNLATFVDMGYKVPGAFSAPELWLIAYAFAFQIYFDFSGYTDIARGSARLFGYNIPINFNMPYFANNVSNFWHRWHISLSTWLRDYLYIPLGGSRGGKWATQRNLFLTMALGGLWHGASWNFAVWGIYHGLALAIHREFTAFKDQKEQLQKICRSKLFNLISIVFTFHVVCIGWVFFRVTDIGAALKITMKMLSLKSMGSIFHPEKFILLQDHLPVIVIVALIMTVVLALSNLPFSYLSERGIFNKAPAPLKGVFCAILVMLMVTFLPDGSQPFIYFQF